MGIEILQRGKTLKSEDAVLLESMRVAAAFMANTLNNVLSLQKMEDGTLCLDLGAFNMVEAVSTVLAACKLVADSKNVQLVKYLSPDMPRSIRGDRFKIEHVINNLLSNAIKFSPHDSVISVKLSCEHQEADPRSGNTRVLIKLSVTDQGPGLSSDSLKNLFLKQSQSRPDTLQKGQGSGLGLAISKQIVELHGGIIEAQSQEGQGCIFSFHIPFDI
jgi:signal transduction histidine kinase